MLGNTLKTTALLAALSGMFVLIGGALGGQTGMVLALVVAAVMNLGAYWFSGDIALKMAGAREIGVDEAPWLHAMVEELAREATLPKPRVAVVESPAPNAFATGRDPGHAVVAVTTGIVQILDRRELRAVLAHELGHVRNRDVLVSSIAATIGGAITMLANIAQWSLLFGGFGSSNSDEEQGGGIAGMVGGLLMIVLAPLAAMIIQMAISRAREYGADRTGAELSSDPEALARALEKLEAGSQQVPLQVNPAAAHLFIVNPLKGMSLAGLFSTHPPIAERARRLREMRAQRFVA
jgi:heat shock protein HtpX